MIITQSDFHSIPLSGFRHTPSLKSPLLLAISLRPELPPPPPFYYHYSNELSICDAFDHTHFPCIIDTLHIIRSVFKLHFIHYTKYANYAFLLLFSIYGKSFKNVPRIFRLVLGCVFTRSSEFQF